jgi:MerR family transcriptional regulator, light-induced transcriptional regulator
MEINALQARNFIIAFPPDDVACARAGTAGERKEAENRPHTRQGRDQQMPNSRGWGGSGARYDDGSAINAITNPPSMSPTEFGQRVGLESLASTIENIIVPRLLMSHLATDELARHFTINLDANAVEGFAELTIRDDPRAASDLVRAMLDRGIPFEDILMDLLAPAARVLGERWVADKCTFVDVTIGVARMHRILREFNGIPERLWNSSGAGHRCLLMPVPGEQHTFGIRMVEEFLMRDGWEVDNRFPATDQDLEKTVSHESYDFVGFSLMGETLIKPLIESIKVVRTTSLNPHVRVMVGGVVFVEQPELCDLCGADAYAADAVTAVRLANQWVEPVQQKMGA